MRLTQPWPFALASLLLLGACTGADESKPPISQSVELIPLPQSYLAKCERFPELEPVCPRSIPPIGSDQSRAQSFRSGKHVVFFAEWSAHYPGITDKNAPPRFLHLNVHGGDLASAFPFEWPSTPSELPNPPPKKRADALLLDDVTWFGKAGSLVLAPRYPSGGIDGDHLIFRWGGTEEAWAISLHAWLPLSETRAALKAVVGSIPAP
jgi:hypothetical protein